MPFLSFSSLKEVAKTWNTTLNRRGVESEHSSLALDFMEKSFSMSSLSIMLGIDFSRMSFELPFIPCLLSYFFKNREWMLDFVNCFLFFFSLLICELYWLTNVKSILHCWYKSHLVIIKYHDQNYPLLNLLKFWLEFLHLYFWSILVYM